MRARFFTVEEAEIEELDRSPWLLERENLASTDFELTPEAPPAESSSNRRAVTSARDSSIPPQTRPRFVRQIASVTAAFIKRNAMHRVAFVAAADFLELLRQQADELLPGEVQRLELSKDLCNHTLAQIQAALTLHGILPTTQAHGITGAAVPSLRFAPRSNPV
jgi:hypothetical protein